MGLSIGLDTAVSGLRAMQLAIDTRAHNVANADTEGYSRQEVQFRAIPPVQSKFPTNGVPLQQLGLGVDSSRIRRLRDALLDVQYRDVRGLRDEYNARSQALQQTEVVLNEPSDQGIQALMNRFFNAFRDLTAQPESNAARATVVEQGATLAAAFNRTYQLLTNQRADLDAAVETKVTEVNSVAQEVADLNAQIRKITIAGGTSNDLHDRRDLLLDKLAGLVGATSTSGADDTVDVWIGNRKLVDNVTVDNLTTTPDSGNFNLRKVIWSSDSGNTVLTTGEIKGVTTARDTNVTSLITQVNSVASALITAVNGHHQTGYGLPPGNATGLDFFTGADAASIDVNGFLRANPQDVATSDAPDEPGNPNVARDIAGVQSELLMSGGTATLDDAYRAIITALGVSSQQATSLADNQQTLTDHLETARQSVMGVSLDEEMAGMMKDQHAYQASAKVITAVDAMLDTLINRTI